MFFFHGLNEYTLDAMIKTVALEMKWLPDKIGSLFLDNIDHHGIIYWDSEIRYQIEEIKKATKKPGGNK